jgi:hypothetical protein
MIFVEFGEVIDVMVGPLGQEVVRERYCSVIDREHPVMGDPHMSPSQARETDYTISLSSQAMD